MKDHIKEYVVIKTCKYCKDSNINSNDKNIKKNKHCLDNKFISIPILMPMIDMTDSDL